MDGLLGVPQRELRLVEKGQPGFGRGGAFAAALQQPGAELTFQSADLLAQRRLHHIQLHGGAAHGAQFYYTHKVAQLAQFHHQSLAVFASQVAVFIG